MRATRAFFLAILSLPCVAAALTMTPYVANQTTCQQCFFPDPIAVFVRDGTLPAPGVSVTFSAASNAYIPNAGTGPWTVITDSEGVARAPAPGYIGQTSGTATVIASAPSVPDVTFTLTVSGAGPASISVGYNLHLTGVVNQPYAQRFAARAFGADGQPLPNAAVIFITPGGGPAPSVEFAVGSNIAYGQASSLGYAVAPEMTANGVTGHGQVLASTLDFAVMVPFDFWNSAAGVASIEPVAGSTPQSARIFAAFPQPIGAMVRDASGNPVRDAAVRFLVSFGGGYGVFVTDSEMSAEAIVMTGGDGRARAPGLAMATSAGPVNMTADVPGASSNVQYALTAVDGAPARFEIVSGSGQRAIVNTTYPLPWTVRAVGADGLPVPYAVMQFFADPRPGLPSGLFAGRNTLFAFADAQGVASSPAFTANAVVGAYFGSASGFTVDNQAPFITFTYENVTAELDVTFLGAGDLPWNAPVGGTLWTQFTGYVSNRLSQPAAGVGVTWQVDSSCGRFAGGQTSARGVTDGSGRALSPVYEAVAATSSCFVAFTADGSHMGVAVSVHNFLPSSIWLAASSASVDAVVNTAFSINVGMFADGAPVYYPAAINVTTSNSGATATVQSAVQTLGYGNVRIDLLANGKQGNYHVLVGAGAGLADIAVSQKRK